MLLSSVKTKVSSNIILKMLLFLDIDECSLNRNLCLSGRCKNTHGSFVCECDLGYSVKGDQGGCTGDCFYSDRYKIRLFYYLLCKKIEVNNT